MKKLTCFAKKSIQFADGRTAMLAYLRSENNGFASGQTVFANYIGEDECVGKTIEVPEAQINERVGSDGKTRLWLG